MKNLMNSTPEKPSDNFVRHIITDDLSVNKNNGKVLTRFPPEPNGYLHIGHAKSICLNFSLADEFKGSCNLRFDDTNPERENIEFMQSIETDVQWLGFKWANKFHASDYFAKLYDYAVQLITNNYAYVDSLSTEQIRDYRGTLIEAGRQSPDRNRSVANNLVLFAGMRNGDYADGQYILRAKIDMASANINMRDPILYRIRRVHHQRTGDKWCLYPTYDFTHCICDAIEYITHSLCTLEFADHRPLYNWILEKLQLTCRPQQIEFARLRLEYTIISKRKLAQLVEENYVSGWDDPRMPTISGLRRAGYTPQAMRNFCACIGVTKKDSWIKMAVLENCIREDLNQNSPRVMVVLRPMRVVIENYSKDKTEILLAKNHPQKPELGDRKLLFSKVILIEQDDFSDNPTSKYKRLIAGGEVRLRNAYIIKCKTVVKDIAGNISELRCTCDFATLGKKPVGRKVAGVIHWVSEQHSLPVKIHLYDRLFCVANPEAQANFLDAINTNSLETLSNSRAEASLVEAKPGNRFQFERNGYFCVDTVESTGKQLVFNRTVSLRDTWDS